MNIAPLNRTDYSKTSLMHHGRLQILNWSGRRQRNKKPMRRETGRRRRRLRPLASCRYASWLPSSAATERNSARGLPPRNGARLRRNSARGLPPRNRARLRRRLRKGLKTELRRTCCRTNQSPDPAQPRLRWPMLPPPLSGKRRLRRQQMRSFRRVPLRMLPAGAFGAVEAEARALAERRKELLPKGRIKATEKARTLGLGSRASGKNHRPRLRARPGKLDRLPVATEALGMRQRQQGLLLSCTVRAAALRQLWDRRHRGAGVVACLSAASEGMQRTR